ncbi:unnamed protein product [Cunninghamella blakesleeana]
MYDPDLNYIAISYRWGESNKQLVETPDYTAHITSFDLYDLKRLCLYIIYEPDLCDIEYLWVDAISVDQQNHTRKKETILKMNQIYQKATYILTVPDLHWRSLSYQFLAYLIRDWSNRAWVISEYHIAKEKYKKHGTPLKYCFICLFGFMQQSHLDIILNSNAARNEDRFNAILPSWDKYNHLIKNRSTISEWNITDMTSVRLKLYEIMDDLWDKATLLYICSKSFGIAIILPSFASHYERHYLKNAENFTYKAFEEDILHRMIMGLGKTESAKIKQLMNKFKTNSKLIWTENLTNVQLVNHHSLSIKSNSYFINPAVKYKSEWEGQSLLSLDDHDKIHKVFIPFFTFTTTRYIDFPDVYEYCAGIHLVGNIDKNRWLLIGASFDYKQEDYSSDPYAFTIF